MIEAHEPLQHAIFDADYAGYTRRPASRYEALCAAHRRVPRCWSWAAGTVSGR